jgi:hypothetical protein
MVRFSSEHGEDLSFSVLTTQTFRRSSPFVVPTKTGIQRRANGKTAEKASGDTIKQNVLDLGIPASTGMTESGIAFRPECKKSFKNVVNL